MKQKCIKLFKMAEDKVLASDQPSVRQLIYTLHPQGSENISERPERMREVGDGREDCYGMLSSGRDVVVAWATSHITSAVICRRLSQ